MAQKPTPPVHRGGHAREDDDNGPPHAAQHVAPGQQVASAPVGAIKTGPIGYDAAGNVWLLGGGTGILPIWVATISGVVLPGMTDVTSGGTATED
jgi:hypothetical protein